MPVRTKTIHYERKANEEARYVITFGIENNNIIHIQCTDMQYDIHAKISKTDGGFKIGNTLITKDQQSYPADNLLKAVKHALDDNKYDFFGRSDQDVSSTTMECGMDSITKPLLTIATLAAHEDSWYDH